MASLHPKRLRACQVEAINGLEAPHAEGKPYALFQLALLAREDFPI